MVRVRTFRIVTRILFAVIAFTCVVALMISLWDAFNGVNLDRNPSVKFSKSLDINNDSHKVKQHSESRMSMLERYVKLNQIRQQAEVEEYEYENDEYEYEHEEYEHVLNWNPATWATRKSTLDNDTSHSMAKQSEVESTKRTRKTTKRTDKVLLFADFRTGSTFIGQIFNRNPNMFYMFEPVWVFRCLRQFGAEFHHYENTTVKLLERIFRCEFSEQFASCFFNFAVGVYYTDFLHLILEKSFKFDRYFSPGEILRKLCLKYKGNVAIKTIRSKMEDIVGILKQDSDVKVIHLVRDPRGVINSRRLILLTPKERAEYKKYLRGELDVRPYIPSLTDCGFFQSPNPKATLDSQNINKYCHQLQNNIKVIIKDRILLRNRYKLVRYEDFAAEPGRITDEIYSFLGSSTPRDVKRWLKLNTNASDAKSDDNSNMGLAKNSLATAIKWRLYFSKEELFQVQAVCADIMKVLGYRLFAKENSLIDLNVSAIVPHSLEADLFIS